MNPSMISVFSALAAAVWSVWTWQSEQQKLREDKRNEMSAQYVNNFILATQQLQRKIFKILQEDELAHYKLKHAESVDPFSPIAIELLFNFGAFFGWELMTFRFGPYTRDPKMIGMMAQIGELLENRNNFTGEAFRFTLGDRHALGQAVVRRVGETTSGPAFVNITTFKFEEDLVDAHSEWARLFRSENVRCALAAVDRAVAGEPLEGRERLAVLQNLLVDLVAYLEQKEGFRTSFGKRKRATVEENYAEVVSQNSEEMQILHQMMGRIRLRIPRLHLDRTYSSHLQNLLLSLDHVKYVRINVDAACVVIEYSTDVPPAEFVQTVVAKLENDSDASGSSDQVLHALEFLQSRS
jgi:hypothetical protein